MRADDARFLLCRSAERMSEITDDIEELLATGDEKIEVKLQSLFDELDRETRSSKSTLARYVTASIREVAGL